MFISIVIPVYKAKDCVDELCRRLCSVLGNEKIIKDYEIILVEDGSRDGTWEKIVDLAGRNLRIRGIGLSRNFGQHKAIAAGLDQAQGDWIVVMDCDLQDRPEDIPLLLQKALHGFDVVCATRKKRIERGWRRIVSNIWYKFFRWTSGFEVDSRLRNYRIMSRKVLGAYKSMRENSQSFIGQVHWLGFPTAYLELAHDERFSGKSSYDFKRLFILGFDFIISYSNKPLSFVVYMGFLISIISLMFGLYIIFKMVFWGASIEGWASLITSIWFLGGFIIANLGIIGIYIGRIFNEVKGRPLYVVAAKINFDRSD